MEALLTYGWMVPICFFTAIITAVTGAGGGVMLLAIMGLAMPAVAVVPVHGAVMSVQNAFRGILLWNKVDWSFIAAGAIGSLIGAALAGPVAVNMPENLMRLILGLGILYLVWAPKLKKPITIKGLTPQMITVLMAIPISMVTMVIGAAGVLFAAIRRRGGHAKEGVLADQSILMLLQHSLKVLVFGLAGFAFGPYLLLIAAMMCMGLAGTWVGVSLMKRMQTEWFDHLFKGILTVLAILGILKALAGYAGLKLLA